MLQKIIQFSVQNKLVVGLFMLMWVAYGTYQVSQLPIDAVPDITNNQVQVITTAPSLGAEDVERLITFPIEQAISNIPGLKESRSLSRFGLSLITLVFDDDSEVYWARQQVTERLSQVDINVNASKPARHPIRSGHDPDRIDLPAATDPGVAYPQAGGRRRVCAARRRHFII